MNISNPQFLYVLLILPSLFGLTLMGDGIYKCAHEEYAGLVTLLFGFAFVGMVVFAYFFFSSYVSSGSV